MNIKNYSKKIKKAKIVCLVFLVCINIFFILLFLLILATSKKEVDVLRISVFVCITWLPSNVMFTILYLRVGNAKSLSTIKAFDGMGKHDCKKLIIAALLECIPTALGIVMILKGAVMIGCGILCTSLIFYIYYQKKLLKKSKGNTETRVTP